MYIFVLIKYGLDTAVLEEISRESVSKHLFVIITQYFCVQLFVVAYFLHT